MGKIYRVEDKEEDVEMEIPGKRNISAITRESRAKKKTIPPISLVRPVSHAFGFYFL